MRWKENELADAGVGAPDFRHHQSFLATTTLFAGDFFLASFLGRLFLTGFFGGFLLRLGGCLFLGGRLFGGCFLGRSFLSWSFFGRRLLWGSAGAATRWSCRRRRRNRWSRSRHSYLVVLDHENGLFFLLFFFLFQILFQRFAIGSAVAVLIRLIVPTVQSRIIEAHISSCVFWSPARCARRALGNLVRPAAKLHCFLVTAGDYSTDRFRGSIVHSR